MSTINNYLRDEMEPESYKKNPKLKQLWENALLKATEYCQEVMWSDKALMERKAQVKGYLRQQLGDAKNWQKEFPKTEIPTMEKLTACLEYLVNVNIK